MGPRIARTLSYICYLTTLRIMLTVKDFCNEDPPTLLLMGVAQFNRGEFFQQHETLEELWNNEARDVRRLYQGILQIGVAMYHITKNNHHGAVYMATKGSNYLRPFVPSCQTVDVSNLLEQATRILKELGHLGPGNLDKFNWSLSPQVRIVEK